MAVRSYVVVFPSVFARRHIAVLARNIRRILDVQNEPYASVRRDGGIILVDAHDPVFASTAIGLLFGVERTLIARQVENDYDRIVETISEVGGNLLLAADRFLVKAEGHSKGFLPQDVEMAATSRIIESKSSLGARPGTDADHDKMLYAYMTRKNAYVSIFEDNCLGGMPLGVQGAAECCIFDPLSAVAALEAIRLGFEINILVCYTRPSQRMGLARLLNRISPRLAQAGVPVAAIQMSPGGRDYLDTVSLATEILVAEAAEHSTRHIILPVSRMLFAGDVTDRLAARVHDAGMIPVMSLPGDARLFEMAKELNLAGSVIHTAISRRYGQTAIPADMSSQSVMRHDITVPAGPNSLHDILDADW